MEKIIFKTQNAEIKIIDRMDITGSSHHSGSDILFRLHKRKHKQRL